jgi:hypothetical protein
MLIGLINLLAVAFLFAIYPSMPPIRLLPNRPLILDNLFGLLPKSVPLIMLA